MVLAMFWQGLDEDVERLEARLGVRAGGSLFDLRDAAPAEATEREAAADAPASS